MTVWNFHAAGCTLTGAHHGTLTAINRRPPAQAGWKPSVEFVCTVDCGPAAGETVSRRAPQTDSFGGDLYKFLQTACGGQVPPNFDPVSMLGRRFHVVMAPTGKEQYTRIEHLTPAGPEAPAPTMQVAVQQAVQDVVPQPPMQQSVPQVQQPMQPPVQQVQQPLQQPVQQVVQQPVVQQQAVQPPPVQQAVQQPMPAQVQQPQQPHFDVQAEELF